MLTIAAVESARHSKHLPLVAHGYAGFLWGMIFCFWEMTSIFPLLALQVSESFEAIKGLVKGEPRI